MIIERCKIIRMKPHHRILRIRYVTCIILLQFAQIHPVVFADQPDYVAPVEVAADAPSALDPNSILFDYIQPEEPTAVEAPQESVPTGTGEVL